MDVKKRLIELSDGSVMEEDLYGIVERVRNYDPSLRIKYLACNGVVSDAPYAIFELCPDGIERKVFDIWELDERVMERLYAADNRKHNILANIDANNNKVRAEQQRNFYERQLADADLIETMLKSNKGRWTFKNDKGALVQIDDSSNGYNGVINARK